MCNVFARTVEQGGWDGVDGRIVERIGCNRVTGGWYDRGSRLNWCEGWIEAGRWGLLWEWRGDTGLGGRAMCGDWGYGVKGSGVAGIWLGVWGRSSGLF
jgi:hypothetical protein